MTRLVKSDEGTLVLSLVLAYAFSNGVLVAQSNIPKPTNGRTVPSFKDVIGLRADGSPRVSPDCKAIAYTVRSTASPKKWLQHRAVVVA